MSRIEGIASQSSRTNSLNGWWKPAWLVVLGGFCCALVSSPVVDARAPSSRQSQEKYQAVLKTSVKELQAKFAAEIEDIAKYCEAQELTLEAEEIRELAKPLKPDVLQGENLPRQVQLEIPKDLPPAERSWRQRLRTLQREHAEKLFAAAKKALDKGMISFAYDLVREAARHNPDHEFARKLLGYERFENEWVTIYAGKMLRSKYVLTDKYGWLKKDHVERYENGERFYDGRWMSTAREAEFRRDFQNAWEIQTDHYKIYTNHSLEMGVELGRHLEDFHRIFFQTFAGFLSSREQLKKLFTGTGGSGGTASDPFIVHYYRTEEEYVTRLQRSLKQPVKGTSGLYLSGKRTDVDKRVAHFFHNLQATQEERLATMFHEATHQLFAEAYTSNPEVGIERNFWVIEAIACYMESFQRKGDTFSLGDPHYIRFQNAQYRLLNDSYYVPLQTLCGMGMEAFQSNPNRSQNYSQGSGLAHFFMHYDDGAYRDAFIAYLAAIYNRNQKIRNNPPTLPELTEVSYEKLDQQYRDYISELDTGLIVEPANAAAP